MTALGDAMARVVQRMAEPESETVRLPSHCKLEISPPDNPLVCFYCDQPLPHK